MILKRHKSDETIFTSKVAPVCGIVIDKKPNTPEDDLNDDYIWKINNIHSPDLVQDQIDGFAYASIDSQYIYLRKLRNRLTHRFETVDHVFLGNAVIYLGDCRITSSSITRDVIRIKPSKSYKLHTLTCVTSKLGVETYVCGGSSYQICYS